VSPGDQDALRAPLGSFGDRGTSPGPGPSPGPGRADETPVVALVGRANVGKSALANRLVGRRAAIVEPRPGVTRDRNVLPAQWAGRSFSVVDTGGIGEDGGELEARVGAQARTAAAGADVVVFVVDATVGVTREDEEVAAFLRRVRRPVLLVGNKVDSQRREADAWELVRLGFGSPIMVSALHGRGAGELLDRIAELLPAAPGAGPGSPDRSGRAEVPPAGERPELGDATTPAEQRSRGPIPGVVIVGRPNVGKSTLLNRVAGDERVVVHDQPGTTRDAVDTLVETEAGSVRFVDTAGLRRAGRVGEAVEYYSSIRALEAINRADIALLVVDASSGVTHQDQRLAERVEAAGSPVVVVLNKWELLDAGRRGEVRAQVADRLGFLGDAPVVAISAKTGLGVHKLVPAISTALGAYRRRVATGALNQLVQEAQARHPPSGARVLYAVQGAADPPTITLFATRPLPRSWLRYLERRLKERFGLGPTPIKLRVRIRGAR
jgi:GTP-binding protein